MKKFIKVLIITVSLITLKGCNESRVLEDNTKESGLSKYNVTYKYLNSEVLGEGYVFEPLYFKEDYIYGLFNLYPKNMKVDVDDEDRNIKYMIDKEGDFKEYNNSLIDKYLNDIKIRSSIRNKEIYTSGVNYYYSDFENDSLKELKWLKEEMEIIKEKTERLDSEYKFDKLVYKYKNIELYEVVTMNYKEDNGTRVAYKDNYKFIYCIDLENEEVYISDILKEEESLAYYYNESLEKFIKVNKNGVFEELDLVDNKILIKENKKENLDINSYYNSNLIFNDFTVVLYNNRDLETNESLDSETLVINNEDNNYRIHSYNGNDLSNYTNIDNKNKDSSNIFLVNKIENSNYFIGIYNDKYYLGNITSNLELELIKELDFNYEMYGDGDAVQTTTFSNEDGRKSLITIKSTNFNKDNKYAYNKIQYIYLEIDERD